VPSRGLVVSCLAVLTFLALPVASALACAGEQSQPYAVSDVTYERAVECLVNQQRAAAGVSALAHDRHLARAAGRFSTSMVRQQFFSHVSPQGSTPDARAHAAGYSGGSLGETIGWGEGELATPVAIVEGWMESPPHRSILLGGAFRRIGLGMASGSPSGTSGAATVTADLGG
jgi:uncharacterized protein YkwD